MTAVQSTCATEQLNRLERGRPFPMGSCARDGGVNFAVHSANATAIWLCVFGINGDEAEQRLRMNGPIDGVFFGFLPDAPIGLVYGYRAQGPYEPWRGHLFNPSKLLLDPYAKQIEGSFVWTDLHFGYQRLGEVNLQKMDHSDNAHVALKAKVAEDIGRATSLDARPYVPPEKVVLYEVHVKGISQLNPMIDPALRGTYLGLCSDAAITYFKSLGVTTLSLLPTQYHVDEHALHQRGLVNYWGYNTHGFFCADPKLCSNPDSTAQANAEFCQMVQRLHAHDLQVVLDVVYNHTAEADEYGPTLSFRGLDNATWYHLDYNHNGHCQNYTGCGNTLNVSHPRVAQFVLDSLRYWVEYMGVDGFRFDLASILGRDDHGYSSQAVFFRALLQDPILSRIHLIAEPWDATADGYQMGNFPGTFLDWNDQFRDTVRKFWLTRGVTRGEFAKRFCASSDVFQIRGRQPQASVNYISVHDGYTLTDMVSFHEKNNFANGENNRDGRDQEPSANFGVEGVTSDIGVTAQRNAVRKALIATLLLAQGTPMICAGDEIGRTQNGNNNPYCQDNAISWLDWAQADQSFLSFVQRLLRLRASTPELTWLHWPGLVQSGFESDIQISWSLPGGQTLCAQAWDDPRHHAFACSMTLVNDLAAQSDSTKASNLPLMVLFNPQTEPIDFVLPAGFWFCLLDTSGGLDEHRVIGQAKASAHALLVLRKL